MNLINRLFSLEGQIAVVTGGTGVLGGMMARGLAQAGAKVAVLGRRADKAQAASEVILSEGGMALPLAADVMDAPSLLEARERIMAEWGRIDILVNAAGGTTPAATIAPDQSFFDAPLEPMREVIDLNLIGTLLPTQIFGAVMAETKMGSIVNISSLSAHRALTRAVAYSAGKAAVENFTRWLAVELAQKYGQGMRVNAIAPGFFLGEQNRRLLINEDNTLTARGHAILQHTPAGRFGEPDDLLGALIWLCSPGARFVTGTVVFVDGGFNAFSGV
ncbi:MAG: D-mannonate oxidoreductase [Phototrophicales bacterium]|nr:MAG: D-mannonate oxidoreductase [Phototrophicales bacterium]